MKRPLLVLLLVALAAGQLQAARGWFGAPGTWRLFWRPPLNDPPEKQQSLHQPTDANGIVKQDADNTHRFKIRATTSDDDNVSSHLADKLLSRLTIATTQRLHAPRIRFG